MSGLARVTVLLCLLGFWGLGTARESQADAGKPPEFVVPELSQPVMDLGELMDPVSERALNTLLVQLFRSGGTQLAVLTVPTVAPFTVEQAGIQVAEAWKLGSAEQDNGIIFLVSRDDRRMRIEVGQGREGDLPDIFAKRIIDDVVAPFFRRGQMSEGIKAGVLGILERTDPQFMAAEGFRQWGSARGHLDRNELRDGSRPPKSPLRLIFEMILGAIGLFFLLFTRMGRFLLLLFLFRSGRGGYGGSFGGGGFSGGGGGFSGGGASGGW